MAANGKLGAREFLFLAEEEAMAGLAEELRPPGRKVMWTILQLFYGDPRVHFELQPQPSRGQVELGLHFEGPVELNDVRASIVARDACRWMAALGPAWELEAWTASWRRLHRTFPFETLDRALALEVAAELRKAVETLGPVVRDEM